MTSPFVLFLFNACLFGSQDQDPAGVISTEQKKLAGTWVVASWEKAGKPVPEKAIKEMHWQFTGDKLVIKQGARIVAAGTFKIQPGQTPTMLDYREGPDIMSAYDSAIYEIVGDTLKICTSADRKKRPGRFDSKEGWLFVLARAGTQRKNDAEKTPAKDKAGWKQLFDGKSLAGWKSTNFGGEGNVSVEVGAVIMEQGSQMTGITYTRGDFPRMDYEITLEAKKLKGNDFFCTTTFPVADSHCSLVVGGWGGTVVGLSSIDFRDASENETTATRTFKQNQWYRIRIRVTKERIQAWIDDKKIVDAETKDKKISIRIECELSKPFGICTWNTSGAVRDIRVRMLTAAEKRAK